jgi:hypothetical protein
MVNMRSGFPILVGACLVALFAGCSTTNQTRLNTNIRAVRYNDLAWDYYPYPLRIEFDGKRLIIHPTEYGGKSRFWVSKKSSPDFIAAIDKYAKWEQTATERGDQITKTIDRISYGGMWMVAQFHSGNSTTHFISFGIRSQVLGENAKVSGVADLVLDKENALAFRKLLVDFRDGRIETTDLDEVYR